MVGGPSCNHNVSNAKILYWLIDTSYGIQTTVHLNMGWHLDDMTVLFIQAVNDSQVLTYIVENFLNVMNTDPRTSTLVNIPLK